MNSPAPAPVVPTEAQENDLRYLKAHFPFRICWGSLDKETGEWSTFASFDKRAMNAAARKGHTVFRLQ